MWSSSPYVWAAPFIWWSIRFSLLSGTGPTLAGSSTRPTGKPPLFANSGLRLHDASRMLPRVPALTLRRAVRAFLLDADDRVLLVRWNFQDPDGPVDVWGVPGGGIDDGEAPQAAIRRELLEETGLDLDDCGACVAHRRHVMPMRSTDGRDWDGQEEWFYLVRVDAFEPRGHLTDDELRQENLVELRWCTADEVAELAERPRTFCAPRDLANVVRRLAADGHPATPYELGV
jgi:8-oxo-dGTP diphosphatase